MCMGFVNLKRLVMKIPNATQNYSRKWARSAASNSDPLRVGAITIQQHHSVGAI